MESNPGPVPKCGTCFKPVAKSHHSIECDTCQQWVHIKCGKVTLKEYKQLLNQSHFDWSCPQCLQVPASSTETSTDDINHECPAADLKIMSINCNSLVGSEKRCQLMQLIDEHQPDIICGCETKLDNTIYDQEVFPTDTYEIYRKDNKKGEGGVFVAIRSSIASSHQPALNTDCEIIWVSIKMLNDRKPLYIGSFYRSPTANHDQYQILEELNRSLELLTSHQSLPNIILCGDFNLPDSDWGTYEVVDQPQYPAKLTNCALDIIWDNFLTQVNEEPTRFDKILDLVLTTEPDNVQYVSVVPGMSDHEAVITGIARKPFRLKNAKRTVYIYKRANTYAIREDISKLCETLNDYSPADAQTLWAEFKKTIITSTQRNVPTKRLSTRWNLRWVTPRIRRLCQRKKRAWKQSKRSGKLQDWERYQELKRAVRKELTREETNFTNSLLNENELTNTKKFFALINNKRTQVSRIPVLVVENATITDAKEKAEALAAQYSSVFTKENDDALPHCDIVNNQCMQPITFTEPGVYKQLKSLDPSKAKGPDNIPTKILKETAEECAPILTKLFNLSYQSGIIPDDWKDANVHAVFKKGSKVKPANYRPVSLTSVCCKIIEHIIHSSVMKFLQQNKILVKFQHGFRAGHSCETQLITTIDDLATNMDEKCQTDMIILDFSKAFDTVPHRRLILKLKAYNIDSKTIRWIEQWLHMRSQTVVVDGQQSKASQVISGVPQGTVLGPLLFLLYINDIASGTSSTIKLFADDCVIYRRVTTAADCLALQSDLDKLVSWSDKWLMSFNVKKCVTMTITNKKTRISADSPYNIRGVPLDEVTTAKYLGVTLSENLSWKPHINEICTKAGNTLSFLRRNFSRANTSIKSRMYTTLVRPQMEYACAVWDPHSKVNKDKLDKVQRRAARFAHSKYSRRDSVTAMLTALAWPSLEERRRTSRLNHFQNAVSGKSALTIPNYVKPSTRDPRRYIVPASRINVHKHSYFPQTVRDWNNTLARATNQTTRQ